MEVVFYLTNSGNEPVREFLKSLSKEDKVVVGRDIQAVQIGFPLGMPLCRPLGGGLHEIRSSGPSKREIRCIFTVYQRKIWLLHGFIKTTRTTPKQDLALARSRIPR